MHAMLPLLRPSDFPPLKRRSISTLQVNLCYRCNQSCLHCHVNAGPKRKEQMDDDTLALVLKTLADCGIGTLDVTGGAPELHPGFRHLVQEATQQGVHVMDRCNLTILDEPGQQGLAEFLARHRVEIIASLPCYLRENVDQQRGKGVYSRSIQGLRQLNALGYGQPETGLQLNLVYNPVGDHLPPSQCALEADYRRELKQRFGIVFNQLYTITNMPIARFGSTLVSHGKLESYMQLLRQSMQAANLDNVMCRDLVSVDYRGYLYDCDFNQMLDLPLGGQQSRRHLRELPALLRNAPPIEIADHCYGCTAGQGSSCGGSLTT